MKMQVLQSESRIPLTDCSNLAINQKNDDDITTCQHEIIVNFFDDVFFSLLSFSYWSKFHDNITTGSGFMTTFFYKQLFRNMEIGNAPA